MRLRSLIIVAAVLGLFLLNSNATAGYLDSGWENITIFDGYKKNAGNKDQKKWWNTKNEDQEVEPYAQIGQQWDLEGFFLSDGTDSAIKDNELAMVGGFNFEEGQSGIASGDIFIDTDMENDYYEYVMDLDFDALEYTVIENTDGKIKYKKTKGGPSETKGEAWIYKSGGTVVTNWQGVALNYLSNLNDGQMGGDVTGGSHNAVVANLSFLGANTGFSLWSTMECGNDVLTGKGDTSAAVPEPATIFLLGSGLLGLFGFRKKIRKTDN